MIRSWITAMALSLGAAPLAAHEFWIEPHAFQIAPGGELVADIRVGDKLEGATYSYNPRGFSRFELVAGGQTREVPGRAGDKPAIDLQPDLGDTLATLVHVTREQRMAYRDWDHFVGFCEHKDCRWALDRHKARGLDPDSVRERYTRYAKSLVAIGEGAGADAVTGLEVEIVALANPYTDDLSAGLPVRVLYQGQPRADAQVELFARDAEGEVTITLHRTDAEGRVTLPVRPGHFYLVDSVVMREVDTSAGGEVAWESLWASLTFAVPG